MSCKHQSNNHLELTPHRFSFHLHQLIQFCCCTTALTIISTYHVLAKRKWYNHCQVNEGFAFLAPAALCFFATFTVKSLLCTKPVLQLPVKCFRAPAARTAFPLPQLPFAVRALSSLFSQQQSSLCCPLLPLNWETTFCIQDIQMQNKVSKSFQHCN